jgi:hypothetical protein
MPSNVTIILMTVIKVIVSNIHDRHYITPFNSLNKYQIMFENKAYSVYSYLCNTIKVWIIRKSNLVSKK